MLFRKRGAFLE